MGICAYCEGEKTLTREHIFPNWLLRATDYQTAYSEKAGRKISRNQTIRDVCADCNNGPLGTLDNYAQGLYQTYMVDWVRDGQTVYFRYDYGLFVRWLLKVCYNSCRTTGVDLDALRQYRDALVTPYPCSPIFMAVFVGTIKPLYLCDIKTRTERTLYPQGVRIGRLHTQADANRHYALRSIQINSFRFSIMITEEGAIDVEEMEAIWPLMYGAPLMPTGQVLIPPPRLNTMQAMQGVESWPD